MRARFDQGDARFAEMEARFKQIDDRFDQMDKRFDRLEFKLYEAIHSLRLLYEEQNARNAFTLDQLGPFKLVKPREL